MYAQFRAQYPLGSLTSELLQAQEGYFLVRTVIQVGEVVMASGFAAAATIEQAEDQARARALVVLGIEQPNIPTQAHLLESADQATSDQEPARLNPAIQNGMLPMPGQLPAQADPIPEWGESDSISQLQEIETAQTAKEPLTPQSNGKDPNGKDRRTEKVGTVSLRRHSKRTNQLEERVEVPSQPVDLSEIIAQTDVELKRLGWTSTQGRKHLQKTYDKRSRQQLTDEELLEFLGYLQSQPSKDEPPF